MPAKKAARKHARQPLKLAGAATNLTSDTVALLLYLQLSADQLKEQLRTRGIGIPALKSEMCQRLAEHLTGLDRTFTLVLS